MPRLFALYVSNLLELNERGDIDLKEACLQILRISFLDFSDSPEMDYVQNAIYNIAYEWHGESPSHQLLDRIKLIISNYLEGKREPVVCFLIAVYYIYNEAGESLSSIGVQIQKIGNEIVIESGNGNIKSVIRDKIENLNLKSEDELAVLKSAMEVLPRRVGKYVLGETQIEKLLKD